MQLKANLYYDLKRDEIVDLYDIGNSKKVLLPARNATVIDYG